MKSVRHVAFTSLLSLAAVSSITTAIAGDFPGTGSKEAWQQACQLSTQGNSLLQSGQHNQGFELLHKAIAIYPYDAELLYNLGGAHQAYSHMTNSEGAKIAELEKAETYLKQAASIKPSQAEVLIRMANVQSELNKDSESIANLKTVLDLQTLDPAMRQRTMQALQYVQSKGGTGAPPTVTSASKPSASGSNAGQWQAYIAPSSLFSLQHPDGWTVSTDPKNGKIEAKNSSGASLAILPFYTPEKLDSSSGFFSSFLNSVAPQEKWSKPEIMGTAMRSSYVSSSEKAVAAIEIYPMANGTGGKICVAKSPVGASAVSSDIFVKIISSLKFDTSAIAAATKNSAGSAATPAETTTTQPSTAAPASDLSAVTYKTFDDPNENAFSVEVPAGWDIKGGLFRAGPIDTRPWVVAVAPDNSCRAFIGDGEICPYTLPSSTLNWTGFTPGKSYNGTLVHDYIPARKFVEKYAREKLKKVLTDIQVVQEHDRPEIASAYNTGASTRSEAHSMKISGMYGSIPAVGYFVASTKANAANGGGMWWVTLIAGEISPAAYDQQGLDVIMHMLKSFKIKPEWQAKSLANTAAVSRNYAAAARVRDQQIQANYANIQAANNRITSGYWAQQAANDRISSGYWSRQASQDHAANNFSNYIRGQETVRDTSTGTNYQVEYGPKYHWIDGGGNYAGTNYSSPGAGWSQLMSVP
jgi:hypothetical protein